MLTLYCLTIALFAFGCRLKKANFDCNGIVLTKTDTLSLKGFCAIMVILHHMVLYSGLDGWFGKINSYVGSAAVGVFFMLSLYGLTKGYQTNGTRYAKTMFFRKIPELYFLQVITNAIYYGAVYQSAGWTTGEVLFRIFNLDMFASSGRMNSFSWFISSILCIYIGVGLVLLFSKQIQKKQFLFPLFVTIAICIFVAIIALTPVTNHFILAIYCAILGTWYATYEKELSIFLKKHQRYAILCTVTLAVIFCARVFGFSLLIIGAEDTSALFVSILFLLLAQRVDFGANKLFCFLGGISLEIYLLQQLVHHFVTAGIKDAQLVVGFTAIAANICVAYLFNIISATVKKGRNGILLAIKRHTSTH